MFTFRQWLEAFDEEEWLQSGKNPFSQEAAIYQAIERIGSLSRVAGRDIPDSDIKRVAEEIYGKPIPLSAIYNFRCKYRREVGSKEDCRRYYAPGITGQATRDIKSPTPPTSQQAKSLKRLDPKVRRILLRLLPQFTSIEELLTALRQ